MWERSDGQKREFPIVGASVLVGRDPEADIRIDEPLVSRAHARIERRGNGFAVLDLGSTNLTRVNGDVVAERQLVDGDELRFGRARCRFWAGSEDPPGDGAAKGS